MTTDIPANVIFGAKRVAESIWPKRSVGARLGETCNPIIRPKFDLKDCKTFFAIGSCFARNIEEYLIRRKLSVLSREIVFPQDELYPGSRPNDLLVKYTPTSILSELSAAFGDHEVSDDKTPIGDGRGKFFDPYLPATYPGVSFDRCVERRREVRGAFRKMADADAIVLTFGLVEDWYDHQLGLYMNSCPTAHMVKEHPDRFSFRILSFDENREAARQILQIIHSVNPNAKVVITTSPVPLGRTFTNRDVIVANTYSKSMLRVISQDVADEFDYVDYFPSFEIVTFSDKLSSWEDDQRHVLDSKVAEIMHIFMEKYLGAGGSAADRTMTQAKVAKEAGEYGKALALYREVEEVFRHDTVVLTDMCDVALRLKQYDDVVRLGRKVLSLEPDHGRAGLLLAQALVALKRLAEAEEVCLYQTKFRIRETRARRWLMEVAKARKNDAEASRQARLILSLVAQGIGPLPEAIMERVRRIGSDTAELKVAL